MYKKLLMFVMFVLFGLMSIACGTGNTGTLKVTLQDAPADVEKLEVPIAEISIHFVPKGSSKKAGDDDPATASSEPQKAGWIKVLKEPKTYDLLALKDNPVELNTLELGEGKITMIRMILDTEKKTIVTVAGKQHEVKVPSGTVRLNHNVSIVPGEETLLPLDFDALESLKEKGKGEYSLSPVLKVLSK